MCIYKYGRYHKAARYASPVHIRTLTQLCYAYACIYEQNLFPASRHNATPNMFNGNTSVCLLACIPNGMRAPCIYARSTAEYGRHCAQRILIHAFRLYTYEHVQSCMPCMRSDTYTCTQALVYMAAIEEKKPRHLPALFGSNA